jgi:hypothetical protein
LGLTDLVVVVVVGGGGGSSSRPPFTSFFMVATNISSPLSQIETKSFFPRFDCLPTTYVFVEVDP